MGIVKHEFGNHWFAFVEHVILSNPCIFLTIVPGLTRPMAHENIAALNLNV